MAKANAATGTSLYVPEGAPVPDDVPDGVRLVGPGAPPEAGAQFAHHEEEGERSSPGTSSSASTGKTQSNDEPNSPNPQPRARTTGRRSSKSAGSESAPSTDGPGPETT